MLIAKGSGPLSTAQQEAQDTFKAMPAEEAGESDRFELTALDRNSRSLLFYPLCHWSIPELLLL